jgi:putative membrane protein
MMGMGSMDGMGGMLAFTLLWLLILAAVAALLIAGGIWLWRRGQPGTGVEVPSARQALDRRYAAGELDRQTYLQIRSDLETSA